MTKFVIGLSGGLDSSVVCALAVQKYGKENVLGVLLPTKNTPIRDIQDATELANKLGIDYQFIRIDEIVDMYPCNHTPKTLGNVMARVRMTILYAIANETGALVLGTSDRSEYEIGFFTKWGDGAADVYPIIHLYKTEVRELAKKLGIPKSIINKPSSPALIKDQTAEEEIGFTYEDIDAMLKGEKPMHPDLQARIESTNHKRVLLPLNNPWGI